MAHFYVSDVPRHTKPCRTPCLPACAVAARPSLPACAYLPTYAPASPATPSSPPPNMQRPPPHSRAPMSRRRASACLPACATHGAFMMVRGPCVRGTRNSHQLRNAYAHAPSRAFRHRHTHIHVGARGQPPPAGSGAQHAKARPATHQLHTQMHSDGSPCKPPRPP